MVEAVVAVDKECALICDRGVVAHAHHSLVDWDVCKVHDFGGRPPIGGGAHLEAGHGSNGSHVVYASFGVPCYVSRCEKGRISKISVIKHLPAI